MNFQQCMTMAICGLIGEVMFFWGAWVGSARLALTGAGIVAIAAIYAVTKHRKAEAQGKEPRK